MKMSFCMECGSELDEHGFCPNTECVNHKGENTEPKAYAEVEFSKDAAAEKTHKKSSSFDVNKLNEQLGSCLNAAKESSEKEKGKLIVPDCVDADQNEIPVKQYDIARLQSILKGAFAEGRLQVTTKRVLFRSSGISVNGPTTMQTEFSIEEIGGIEIRKEPRFNFITTLGLILICALIYPIINNVFTNIYAYGIVDTIIMTALAAVSVITFYLLREKRLLRYVALCVIVSALPLGKYYAPNVIQSLMITVIGIAFVISFLYNAFARNLVIRILTKGGSPAAEIRRKDGWFSFQHNEYTGFSQVIPGPDVDVAIKELGSIIRAIQHGQIS